MSFNIAKSSALEVKLLELHVSGLGVFELSRVSIQMVVNGESYATCVPVMGKDTIKSQEASPNKLAAITPDMRCRIYMKLGNNGNMGENKSMLFEGRLAGDTIQVNSSPLGSSAAVQIQLRHSPVADLGGVSVAQRTYYHDGAVNNPFDMSDYYPYYRVAPFRNTTMEAGKFAVYIKQLVNSLYLWYTNGGANGISIDNILKAVPCVVNQNNFSLKDTVGSICNSLETAAAMTFQGAMGGRSSLLSILSTLCSYCLFNVVPTSNTLVITPKLNVTRWSDDDIYIGKSKIVNITLPYSPQRIPVDRVMINYFSGVNYFEEAGIVEQDKYQNVDWADKFRWPPVDAGGAMLVDPPPILKNIMDVSAMAGDEALNVRLKPLNRGGRPNTAVNSAGRKPYKYSWDTDHRVGTMAAKLEWSRLAFTDRVLQVGLIPHWLFSPSFHSGIGEVYETGTPWGLLGKTVKLRAPYSLVESEKSDDIAYIGYVNLMGMNVSVLEASLTTSITLTNVRTENEDKWAFPADDNPLYDNINAKPV